MKTKILVFSVIILSAFFYFKVSSAKAAEPILLFSDMTDAPTSGWEGSATKGAAVSIYARNIGAARGSSYVSVGGVNLTSDSDYAEWGATTNPTVPLGMQRITFWLNSSMATSGTYPNNTITVTVNGVTSNTLKFHTRALGTNKIYFFDNTNGNDSTCNGLYATPTGGNSCPKKTPGWFRANAVAGDTAYFRNTSTYQTADSDGLYNRAHMQMTGTNHANGSEGLSINVTSYPAEMAYWYSPNTGTPSASDNFTQIIEQKNSAVNYWSFSKLKWYFYSFGWSTDGELATETNHVRFVGMDVSSYGVYYGQGWNMVKGTHMYWLGVWIHDLGIGSDPSTARHYPVYMNGYGANDYIYMGYNEFGPLPAVKNDGEHGGTRAFDIYGHAAGDTIDHLYIFNNYAHHVTRQPMAIGNGDAQPNFLRNVYFYNNIIGPFFTNVGPYGSTAENLMSVGGGFSNQTLAHVKMYNNTFDHRNQTQEPLWITGNPDFQFKNNIVVTNPTDVDHMCTYYASVLPTRFSGSYNLFSGAKIHNLCHDYFGGGTALNETSSLLNADPKFVASTPSTFTEYFLQSTSQAIDGGNAALISEIPEESIAGLYRVGLDKDFYGVSRGSSSDIGAIEYSSGTTPPADTTPPAAPNNVLIS